MHKWDYRHTEVFGQRLATVLFGPATLRSFTARFSKGGCRPIVVAMLFGSVTLHQNSAILNI